MQEPFIYSIKFKKTATNLQSQYPFTIAAVAALEGLAFHPQLTFFTGENGSGKSTVLEALALCCGMNAEGGGRNFSFETYTDTSALCHYIFVVRGARRPQDSYFLRAESFYNVASYIEEIDSVPAAAPPVKESYGGSLHECSHGESFFALLNNRLGANGLYLFDEPESALSPTRQIAMLRRMHQLIQKGCQMIITTHSPILLAYPNSIIYDF